jgi:hypothetical protein
MHGAFRLLAETYLVLSYRKAMKGLKIFSTEKSGIVIQHLIVTEA